MKPKGWRNQWRAQGLDFDELFIGGWFHIESMGDNSWFIEFAGRKFWVHTRKDSPKIYHEELVDTAALRTPRKSRP